MARWATDDPDSGVSSWGTTASGIPVATSGWYTVDGKTTHYTREDVIANGTDLRDSKDPHATKDKKRRHLRAVA